MKKTDMKKLFAFGAVALASSFACAQTASAPTSSVQLYGIVDMAYRHTNNEGPAANKSKDQMIGGGMSQSRWGINVEEDLGGGSKALVTLETVLMPIRARPPPMRRFSSSPMWACRALMAA